MRDNIIPFLPHLIAALVAKTFETGADIKIIRVVRDDAGGAEVTTTFGTFHESVLAIEAEGRVNAR